MYTREQCYHIAFVTNPILCALISYWISDWLWLGIYGRLETSVIYDIAYASGISHAMSGFIEQHVVPLLSAAVITIMYTLNFWRRRIYGQ